jgi:hypothetical protein
MLKGHRLKNLDGKIFVRIELRYQGLFAVFMCCISDLARLEIPDYVYHRSGGVDPDSFDRLLWGDLSELNCL